jgi:hypothetical protein
MTLSINSNKKLRVVAASIILTATLAYCAAADKAIIEAGGTVIDVTTMLPVEGAYVMNVYYESGAALFGHSGHWCVKTKGMYTGKDGKFHFPIAKSSFLYVHAIKPDYFSTHNIGPQKMERLWYGVERVIEDPNLYLKPQDPAKPDFQLDNANVVFEKIYHAEIIKYFPKFQLEDDFQKRIQRWESLPEKSTTK